ncbi:CoA-transferase family III [Coniophora puteana RWD-64-598 SS2]|uniref:CoA-transferase family III n=1 Tax=Coniophora puteana (strain RWD-64-598) TaxID=741705 RepID=A0A5M3MZ46_CONPW|nr:CoA-transferase family III [Coniophora puteana RWD-64-598 SS2]EIW84074.1 CoA-transferase family III [Coniophora puteana RWD-64-598 SS2]
MALSGLKVVEFAGLAPGPFAGLVLAHHGASVVRIDRPGSVSSDNLCSGKKSIALNTKTPAGLAIAKKLLADADVLIDPFRPGVLEKTGLGPEVFYDREDGKRGLNDRLIYARISGFPRDGPHKSMAGHDINYLALSGVLSILPGTKEKPAFPINLIADFGGGGMMCAMGILLALLSRSKTGRGQVVNADMVSGTRYLSTFPLLQANDTASPHFGRERGTNLLDGGAPFYDVYTCADGRWVSVGCLEPQFFATFVHKFNRALADAEGAGAWRPTPSTQLHRSLWPRLREYMEKGFKSKPRRFWEQVFHGSDACVLPVLEPEEAASLARSSRPLAHPNLSRTPSPYATPSYESDKPEILEPGQHTDEILREVGFSEKERRRFACNGAFGEEAREDAKLRSKL